MPASQNWGWTATEPVVRAVEELGNALGAGVGLEAGWLPQRCTSRSTRSARSAALWERHRPKGYAGTPYGADEPRCRAVALALRWMPWGAEMSGDYSPEDIGAQDLWQRWAQ
ncbi:hypothetical protein FBY22_3689 [Streptomyces sp. SLBN-31]|nr:hypothetical protein FBY22_3689 [Streptomyces sp. SLBN-31]